MKTLSVAADPSVQKAVAATATAAAAGVGAGVTWWTTAKEIALELFGVPLPVVLACAATAYGGLSFRSGMTYHQTLWAGVVWTVIGTYGARFTLSIIGGWAGVQIPEAALAGAGMAVAGGGAMFLTRETVQKVRDMINRRIDGVGRRNE